MEVLRRRGALSRFGDVADSRQLEAERLEEVARQAGLEPSYPSGLRQAWANGQIGDQEWLGGLKKWAQSLVDANREGARRNG
jgi:hypothetical protein